MDETSIKSRIEIRYCVDCRWMLRAAWYAQEILSTFEGDIQQVSLSPSQEGGHFSVSLDGEILFTREEEGFIEAKILKRRIRDRVAPHQALGHIDEH